ncbi:MAG: biotin--[acetyl-CoA-carboxylase] ligase [Patescibacteria group bacterium]|nr:biotin--[acetyl-CoA-carboxylase] ligase [Patescibacteria group bacterium]
MIIKNYKILDSTNLKAKELARRGAGAWTVIVAEEQVGGYGRKGTSWFSPKGGLYFSIILPKSNVEDLQTLTILAAFICAKTIKENFNLEPFIKLPNDVWVNGKKVAGILTENVIGKDVKLSVMGIGLNTNIEKFPKELENTATSLKIELEKKVSNIKLLKQIVQSLKEQLKTISE